MSQYETIKANKRLPLSSDVIFRKVFAKEENTDALKSLLEAILNIQIRKIELKNPITDGDEKDSKEGVLDVKVEINDNSVIDVEMQVENEHNIEHRSSFYMVRTASNEMKRGQLYINLKKTVVINLLNFNYFKRNGFMHIAHMKFEKSKPETYIDMGYKVGEEEELATDDLEMIFIELPKFKKKNPKGTTKLNKWLWLIAGEESKVEIDDKKDEEFKKVVKMLDELSMDSKEWEKYEARYKAIINYNSGMEAARLRGLEEGKIAGERKNKIETVKKLLKLKMPIEQIMEITELTKEEINKIKDEK